MKGHAFPLVAKACFIFPRHRSLPLWTTLYLSKEEKSPVSNPEKQGLLEKQVLEENAWKNITFLFKKKKISWLYANEVTSWALLIGQITIE